MIYTSKAKFMQPSLRNSEVQLYIWCSFIVAFTISMIKYHPSIFHTQSIIQAELKRRGELAHTSALGQTAWSAAEAMDELRKSCESCQLARVVEGEMVVDDGKFINLSEKESEKQAENIFIAIITVLSLIIMYLASPPRFCRTSALEGRAVPNPRRGVGRFLAWEIWRSGREGNQF